MFLTLCHCGERTDSDEASTFAEHGASLTLIDCFTLYLFSAQGQLADGHAAQVDSPGWPSSGGSASSPLPKPPPVQLRDG